MTIAAGAARYDARHRRPEPAKAPGPSEPETFDPATLVTSRVARGRARFLAKAGNKQAAAALAAADAIMAKQAAAAQAIEDRRRGMAAVEELEARRLAELA